MKLPVWWKWLSHPLVLLGVTGLAIVFSWSLWQTRRRFTHAQEYTHQLTQSVAQLQAEVDDLAAQTRQASSAAAQERIIRDQLLLQQPGEVVIQLPPLPPVPSPSPSPAPLPPLQAWQRELGF